MGVVAGVILVIIGLFHIFAPRAAWYLHIGWKLKNAEPTEGYLWSIRIGGIVSCVVGVLLAILGGDGGTVHTTVYAQP